MKKERGREFKMDKDKESESERVSFKRRWWR